MNICRKGILCEYATINGYCQLTACVRDMQTQIKKLVPEENGEWRMKVELVFDPEPVNNSRWIYGEDENGDDGYFCEKCGEHVKWNYKADDINFIKKYEFCPYCGRKMNKDEE